LRWSKDRTLYCMTSIFGSSGSKAKDTQPLGVLLVGNAG
jgi:hypothetical protein